MGSDLNITKELQEYILSHGFNLHPVQKEIIDYNTSLGDIKRMQISISQSQFLHLIIKISNIIGIYALPIFFVAFILCIFPEIFIGLFDKIF